MLLTNDQAEHEGEFYCGLCGWVNIADYASHGHPEEKEAMV